jgi:cytochrome c biogenesis protein ResB
MAVHEQRLTRLRPRRDTFTVAYLWRQLQSMTFAIIMLTAILLIVIAGSFLPQDNGITYVYESWWFYGLNFLLMASIISCVSRRAGGVIRFAFKVPVVHRAEFYRSGDTARVLDAPMAPDLAVQAVARTLKARHYRVAIEVREGHTHILADRFRVFRLGTLVSHASIVLLVATIVWGALAGWLDKNILLEAGGPSVPLGHGTGLQLRSDSFNFGLYANGTPSNFHDRLTLVNGNGRQYHQVIDVNTPWYFGGIFGYDIHQASYGMTTRLIAIDNKGQVQPYCVIQLGSTNCANDLEPLLMVPQNDGSYNPAGGGLAAFYLTRQRLAITVTTHDAVPEARLPETVVLTALYPPRKAGEQPRFLKVQADLPVQPRLLGGRVENLSQPVSVAGLRLTILTRRLSSVNVGHNPAVPFIFAACILIIIGLVSVLYFPFTRLWFYVAPADMECTTSLVWMRGSSEKSKQGFKRRFAELTACVQRELRRTPLGSARVHTW